MALTQIADAGLKTPASDLQDNEKIVLGTGNDLEIYHDPSGNGTNRFRSDHVVIIEKKDSEDMASFTPDGAVALYHNGSKKFETNAQGIIVGEDVDNSTSTQGVAIQTGGKIRSRVADTSATAFVVSIEDSGASKVIINGAGNGYFVGGLDIPDSAKIQVGDGDDLEIYHDGSNSYIADVGTGELRIRGTTVRITDHDGSENFANFNDDGGVDLFYDNALKFSTTSLGAGILSTNPLLELSGTATNSGDTGIFINANANHWVIKADNYTAGNQFQIRAGDPSSSELSIACVHNGAVNLYYDNSKTFETVSGGAKVTGTLETTDTISTVGNLDMADSTSTGNNRIRLGTGDDLEIFHDGTNSNINNATGNLKIGCSNTIEINTFDGHAAAKFINDGAVELYHNNVKKFETTADGATCHGFFYTERSGTVARFVAATTDNVDGIEMRHNRGGLSGYSGKMISFRGNDNTEEGSIVIGTTDTAYNGSSDYRLKENQVAISDGITRLKQLKPYRFNWKKEPGRTIDGFFAHEVTPAVPEAVHGEKDAVDSDGNIIKQQIDKSRLVPLLTAALQEAIAKIETLETKVAALEAA